MRALRRAVSGLTAFGVLAVVGCQRNEAKATPPAVAAAPSPPAIPKPAPVLPAPEALDASTGAQVAVPGATIRGQVRFEGAASPEPVEDQSGDPACTKGAPAQPPVLVTAGGLANVVVRVTSEVPPVTASDREVFIDQEGCQYRPRVSAAQRGQTLRVRNSDKALHNVHAYEANKTFLNLGQPPGAKPLEKPLTVKSDVIKLSCDVHPWMLGWVVISENPYFAVTSIDERIELAGLPPGTHTLSAWHEAMGEQRAQVVVPSAGDVEAQFTFRK